MSDVVEYLREKSERDSDLKEDFELRRTELSLEEGTMMLAQQ